MKRVSVSGSPRENVGKKDARKLRREALVPCVLYGGDKQIHFSTPEVSFKDVVYTPVACLIQLEIEGQSYQAVLQDIQFHPVMDNIIHADFLMISDDSPVKLHIPVRLTGNSPGVIRGGKLIIKMRRLYLKGLPHDLPDVIDVDISKLNIGDAFKVGQMKREKIEFLDPASSVVVMVKSARVLTAVDEEEEEEEADSEETAEE